jgi:virginiamycin B lyase
VAGTDGNVWVTVPAAHAICRVSPDGTAHAFVMPASIMPGLIAAGADGNLWFAEPNGMLGRFSPSGIVDEFSAVPHGRNPNAEAEHVLTSGP